jgi:CheY-like chemotaxis protein
VCTGAVVGAVQNRVIVVGEDDRATREMIGIALSTELSAHVMLASNGQRVVDLARRVRPAVIVMDVSMPEMDGLEAIRQLRADSSTADIPVIAVSAVASREEMIEAGCWAFVPKPFRLDDLLQMVEDLVAVRNTAPLRPGDSR